MSFGGEAQGFNGSQGLTRNLDPRGFGRWEVVCHSKYNWMKKPSTELLCTLGYDRSVNQSDIIY